ncbi:MAG: hypothetical protein AB1815_10835 [Bacillota bacterium]
MDSANIQRGLNPPLNEVSFKERRSLSSKQYSSCLAINQAHCHRGNALGFSKTMLKPAADI